MTKISIKLPSNSEPRALQASIKKQLAEFSKKNTCVAEADVRLSHGTSAKSEKTCEIYLKTGEKNMFTIQKGFSFESCLAKAVNKLQQQLNTMYNPIA